MKLPSDDEFEESMSPVINRLDERKWEVARHTTLGAAGLSVAMLFVLTQTGVSTPALWLSMLFSAIAIPIWATLWQIGEAYSFYAVRPEAKLSTKSGLIVGVLLFFAGGSCLLLSFLSLIWHFSVVAAIAFLVASVGGIILTFRHGLTVRSQAEPGGGNGV